MQQHTDHLHHWWRAVLPVALRVVGVVTLCVAVFSLLAFHAAPRASATGLSRLITGSISSSPSSGPVGTTVSVSGSGWGGTDGTPVTFGYEVNSSCTIVSDAQNGSLSGGSFSGWFRWPSGTALTTFSVCAMPGNVMETAGSFSVLSSNPPAVAISPSTVAPGTQATITINNYYPAGTQVNFLWTAGSTVIENLSSAVSNANGEAVLTFTVPKPSIGNGQYTIEATTGGQPPALFSSTNFTYTAPAGSPSPTPTTRPSPSPAPSPTMTPTPGVTATPTSAVTPTAAASATATGATPSAGASPTVGNGQTATTNGTTSGNTGSTNTGTVGSGSSNNALLIGGVLVLLGALLAGLVLLLLVRRRRNAASQMAKALPPRLPDNPAQMAWINSQNPPGFPASNGIMPPPLMNGGVPGNPVFAPYNPTAAPGTFAPQPGNKPALPITPAPVPVGAVAFAGNGNGSAAAANTGQMPPTPSFPQPPAWLADSQSNGSAPAAGGNAPQTMSVPADPALDAMRRQVQSGLFVAPRPYKDERSQ